jgi:SAM-dependent methyltransferase
LKEIPKDALIADVGSGTGRISNYLSMNEFINVFSIDYSLTSLRMIQKNSNNVCVWGNNLHLPLASDSFDFIISTGVIHHTPDPEKAFAECARIIRPGGQFYFKTRNIHSPYGYLFFTYGAMLRFFESKKPLKFLSDLLGFQVYKLTRKIFYSHLPDFPDKILRGKFENLFIKKMITFFTTGQIKKFINQSNLRIKYGRKSSFTHRQHFYVLEKK